MIERLPFSQAAVMAAPDGTPVLCKERAVMDCGCFAAVGIRPDNHEGALGVHPCSGGHVPLMQHFIDQYVASLDSPEDTPAIEVAHDLLLMIFAEPESG